MEDKKSFYYLSFFFFPMKAVVLDFDGIIANTLQLNFEVNRQIFKQYGAVPSLQEFVDLWVSPEPGKEGTDYFVELKGINETADNIRVQKRKAFPTFYKEKAEPMAGSLELIHLLKARGLPLAVVSSNYRGNVLNGLKKFGVEQDFEFVIAAGDSSEHKPDPMPYRLAVERLGFKAPDVLAVEDSDTGVQSAKGAGCRCIAVPNKFTEKGDFSNADLVIKSLLEIDLNLLKKF